MCLFGQYLPIMDRSFYSIGDMSSPAIKLGQWIILSQASVILFTGGLCLSTCWDTSPAKETPGKETPSSQGDPLPSKDTPLARRYHWLGDTPGKEIPPGKETPLTRRHSLARRPPPVHCMLGDMVYNWAVCILLECNLVLCVL